MEAVSESPNVNRAAPSSTTSFSRNPPEPESAGKPPRLFSQPGKENRNVNVAKNVQTASTLPIAESLAEMGRIAINRAAVISATPMMFEVAVLENAIALGLLEPRKVSGSVAWDWYVAKC